jgi:L-rhamnose isomerase
MVTHYVNYYPSNAYSLRAVLLRLALSVWIVHGFDYGFQEDFQDSSSRLTRAAKQIPAQSQVRTVARLFIRARYLDSAGSRYIV